MLGGAHKLPPAREHPFGNALAPNPPFHQRKDLGPGALRIAGTHTAMPTSRAVRPGAASRRLCPCRGSSVRGGPIRTRQTRCTIQSEQVQTDGEVQNFGGRSLWDVSVSPAWSPAVTTSDIYKKEILRLDVQPNIQRRRRMSDRANRNPINPS